MSSPDPLPFAPAERELIRLEFLPRFGGEPLLAEGFHLRTWRSGPKAGQPKVPKAMEGLIARGLVEVAPQSGPFARAHCTPAGLEAVRLLLRDKRSMDPARYAHLRRELGVDPPQAD